jgi:arylsulfatase A-like enzyme
MGKYLNGYRPTDAPAQGWNEWDVVGEGYDEFNYTMRANGTQQKYGTSPEDYLTDVVSSKAVDFVDSSAAAGQPFMLEVAPFAPHAPYVPAPRYSRSDPQAAVPRTPAYDAEPSNPPAWLKGLPPLDSTSQRRLDRIYLQRVRADLATDDLIARLESELAAKGLADNTYFIFSSDNGYHLGEYRLHAGKQTAFDTDINVPLVVTGPGVPAGRVESRLASNIDLAPTFEGIARAPVPSTVDGVSMLGLWHGQAPASWQDAVLIEHHHSTSTRGDPDAQARDSGDPPDYEAVRTSSALYVKYSTGEVEYYDTAHDPMELHNLAASAPPFLPQMLAAVQGCHQASTCQRAAQAP